MTHAVWKVVYRPVTMHTGFGAQRTQHLLTSSELTYEDVCQLVRKYSAKQFRENDKDSYLCWGRHHLRRVRNTRGLPRKVTVTMLQDIWFYAFILSTLLLGWVWGRLRSKFQPLYEIIAGLRLERDAQAHTIEFQRKVIRELEHKITLRGIDDVIKEIQEL